MTEIAAYSVTAETMSKFQGVYPATWTKEFRDAFRAARSNRCERCGRGHMPSNGYALTIHHLTNDKSNCQWWNLAALCQRWRNAAIAAGTWPQ